MTEQPPVLPRTPAQMLWFTVLSILAGVLMAISIVDAGPGLNVVVVGAVMGIGVIVFARDLLSGGDIALAFVAYVFLAMFMVRDSELLLFADLCAAAGLASLAMRGGSGWSDVLAGGFSVLGRLHRSLEPVTRSIRKASHGVDRVVQATWIRGLIVGVLASGVFVALFSSADAEFERIMNNIFNPDWDLGLLPLRVFAALLTICFTGAYASLATVPSVGRLGAIWKVVPGSEAKPVHRPRPEWLIPLALLNLVFALFVVLQMSVLFGGRGLVLETAGLTYAEHARSGFFQLIVVAGLVLGVIALSVRFADVSTDRDRLWLRSLLGLLCVWTFVVLASALKRLGLYEEAFGFTMSRFAAHVSIIWLALVFVGVVIAGISGRSNWLPRAVVWMSAAVLLVVNLVNPEAFVVRRNIERYEATGKIDLHYLSGASADAVPALLSSEAIPECLAKDVAVRGTDEASFWSFNFSRERARELVEPIGLLPPEECWSD